MRAGLLLAGAVTLFSQQQNDSGASVPPPPDKRIFGVLPNYRTVEGGGPYEPIPAKRKFWIAGKDTVDYPVFFVSAFFAGIYQFENSSPEYGQGVKGYAKRYAAAYADQGVGNMLTEGIFPAVMHEDPRYFRKGTGSAGARTRYALSRIFVTRTDAGGTRFNTSEVFGNASAVAISNLYYSGARNAEDNATKLGLQLGTDAISNVLKEFWPDIKRRWFSGRDNASH